MSENARCFRALLALTLLGGVAGMAPVQAQPAPAAVPVAVDQSVDPALRILGVSATAADGRVVVSGRVSRGLRTSVIGNRTLQVELLAADGTVRAREVVHLSAADLARRSTRDAHFRIELDQVPAAGESLTVVMNPRRG